MFCCMVCIIISELAAIVGDTMRRKENSVVYEEPFSQAVKIRHMHCGTEDMLVASAERNGFFFFGSLV